MIRVYKNGKLKKEYKKLNIKYPLHCYMAAKTVKHFTRRSGVKTYEILGITLKSY